MIMDKVKEALPERLRNKNFQQRPRNTNRKRTTKAPDYRYKKS